MYQAIHNYLLTLPIFQTWVAPRTILERFVSLQPRDWKLPLSACESVCGSEELAIAASAALACTQVGIILIDDMLDHDPRGEFQRIGAGPAANLSVAFLSAGQQAILHDLTSPEIKLGALPILNEMIQTVSYGQYLDTITPGDEDAYWRIVKNKSGSFFGSAIHMGALFGGASEHTAKGLETVGRIYGEMIQIHDDLHDTMERPANPDWIEGRSPLPILFARLVEHPDQTRFMELYRNIVVEGALEEAQEILIRCGAVSYCVDQLMQKWESAQEVLAGLSLAKPNVMQALLDEVVAPVRKLLEAV